MKLIVAIVVLLGLTGCADLGDSFVSGAFVDPARYDYYDCKQLKSERDSLAVRMAELQGLMAKAETGVGGFVVAQAAYSNDLISLKAQNKLADEAWRRYKCHEAAPAVTPPAPAAPPAQRATGQPQSSGGAIY
jgi:hypothetical protein